MIDAPVERLIVAQAVYKKVAEEVKTGDPSNLRGAVAQSYRDMYDMTGATSFDLKLDGVKVGTFSFAKTKPEEAWVERLMEVADPEGLRGWIARSDRSAADEYLSANAADFAAWWLAKTGELPEGCRVREVVHEQTEAGIKGNGTMKVDADMVARVLTEHALDEGIAGYLLAGTEE